MDFGLDFRDFTSYKGFQELYVRFQGFQVGFQIFLVRFHDYKDSRDYRDLMYFRLDFRDCRSDFRTFLLRISEVVCPSE